MSLLKYSRVAAVGNIEFPTYNEKDSIFFGTDTIALVAVRDILLGKYHLSREVLPRKFSIRFDRLSKSKFMVVV